MFCFQGFRATAGWKMVENGRSFAFVLKALRMRFKSAARKVSLLLF